ncbi:pyridoxine biosynthesis protein [Coemansia sp. RSA 1358]|nr:pyridoxine biosynthesis protein [Coemansia sp. RSA 1358]
MPALSPTMTEGGIARWEKKEGESFSAGDLLLQIETDKAQMDVEAQDDGVLVKILVPEGTQNVAINSPIAIIAEEGDDASSIDIEALSANKSSSSSAKVSEPSAEQPAQKSEPTPKLESGAVDLHAGDKSAQGLLSPAVTYAIHSNHIANASDIAGSGPKGRILKGDVIRFLKDGKAVIDKNAAESHNTKAPAAASPTSEKPASKSAPSASAPSADAETAFLVQALEPSVLRHLAELELAKKSVTVQVPAEKLTKVLRSNKALSETAFALRATALALHQVTLSKDGNSRVGIAFEGSKTPNVYEIANASTTSIIDLASTIKEAKKGSIPVAGELPAVILANEGLYTPSTLPAATVVVVGKPHTVISAMDANSALTSVLDVLIGNKQSSNVLAQAKSTSAINVSIVSESPAASAFAAKLKGFLSNPELLTF